MPSQPATTNPLPGERIGGYQIEKLLGQSTTSAVYLARSHTQGQAVMLTTFTLPERFSLQAHERFNNRFLRLLPALTHLKHPHILPVSDFGLHAGAPYMVTALTPASTLTAFLQRQSRLSTDQVREIMRQIVDGVEYAHRSGVVHGSLHGGSILLEGEQHIQIAGFGLVQFLALSGIEALQHPYAHLLSVAMTFLGDPFHIAPEVVEGMPVAPGADIYALGILLFELLCGKPPFAEADPLKTALARLHMPVPSLGALRPDLPSALDLVVQRALERDPLLRYPSAGSLLGALEQALREGETAKQVATTTKQSVVFPSMDNGLSDERTREGNEAEAANKGMDIHQQATQGIEHQNTSLLSAVPSLSPSQQTISTESMDSPEKGAIDPFTWWSPASLSADERLAFTWAGADTASPRPTTATASSRLLVNKSRRRLVTTLVAGGVILGGLGTGGVALAHLLQGSPGAQGSTKKASHRVVSGSTRLPRATEPARPSPTALKPSPTATSRPSPTPSPTARPSPTPTPGHTGTVVGSTSQGSNTSKTFTNPADGNNSILIHLSNGNFVAFETACPHEGVTCYYDAGSQKMVCPRHNALFDPKNNAAVLQGPPKRPLTAVPIHVNGDGTITVG